MKLQNIVLTVFIFSSCNIYSQNACKSFWKLSFPEKRWVFTHPFIACKAQKVSIIAISTVNRMMHDTLLDGDASGGQVDAFRHAFWMAMLAQKFNQRKVLSLGRAHEKGNFRKFKKGKTDEEGVIPDSVLCEMDLFNNLIGVEIGSENRKLSDDSLRLLVRSAILGGKMRVVYKNAEGLPLDCNGNPIDMKTYKGQWIIPKYLIPSGTKSRR